MNLIILLIIVQCTENVMCIYLNSSLNGYLYSKSISQSRRRRAHSEYTRWKADFQPTEEFIVKVFEDDLPTRDAQVAPINYVDIKAKDAENPLRSGSESAEIVETGKDLNRDHLILNHFPKSNVDDDKIVSIPVYSNNKIISQKTYKGKLDTKYSKVKFMSVQNENRDALLDSRFLSDSPVQQFAPIEPELLRELTSPPLFQIKPLIPDLKFIAQPNTKATRTSPKSDIVVPMRTFNSEKFSPIRTSKTESFSLNNIVSDSLSAFEYIHPIRTTPFEKPLRKLNKLFNVRLGTTKTIAIGVKGANIDLYKDKDDESIDIETSARTKIVESGKVDEIQNSCQEIELDVIDASTEFADSTYIEKFTSKATKHRTMISELVRRQNSWTHKTNCTLIKKKEFDGLPRTLHEIVLQLKIWAENSPVAKWVDITNGNYTTMENPIYMMIVDDLSKGQIASAKETVLIVAGIQGKDHHAISAAMSLLQQLIEKSDSQSDLLRKYRFWIIPVLNPDGYDYSMTFSLRRYWMKNLRQTWNQGKDNGKHSCQAFGISCTVQTCYGVNLDRNFEYQWIPTQELQAEHPCGSLYAGPRQLSEVETRSLTQYLDKKHIHTFIAYKEGDVLRVQSMRAATAASVAGGRTYVYGQTSEYLPLYAGGIEDWVDGHLGIDNTYSIMMMRRTDDKDPKTLVDRVANEAFAATHALLIPSDYDQDHMPVAMRYRNTGIQKSKEYYVLSITLVILLGNG